MQDKLRTIHKQELDQVLANIHRLQERAKELNVILLTLDAIDAEMKKQESDVKAG